MRPKEIEGRLAGLQARGPTPGLRAQLLADAREEWVRRKVARLAFWQFVRGWLAVVSAAVMICAGISWREESVTARCFARQGETVDPCEMALREVCAEVGLNHGYADRWASVIRERRAPGKGRMALWEELAIE
ncbi:MAG TPA: hypothetical protein PLU30_14805 [Verrucomicrobiae bacterium]|nr:hypothetical protein [Verrucomicrobiae bacterium]